MELQQRKRNKIRGGELHNLLKDLLSGTNLQSARTTIDSYKGNVEFDFHGINWQKLRELSGAKNNLHLPHVNWGKNSLRFVGCDFGDGDLTLAGNFDGDVFFEDVRFGDGAVSFADSKFNKLSIEGRFEGFGEVLFCGCRFNGRTKIDLASLGKKTLNFSSDSEISLKDHQTCQFTGDAFDLKIRKSQGSYINACGAYFCTDVCMEFGEEAELECVDFSATQWKARTVEVKELQVRCGQMPMIQFADADFREVRRLRFTNLGVARGNIGFNYVQFPEFGNTHFSFSDIGKGTVSFIQALCTNSMDFYQGSDRRFSALLSLRGATFEGPLKIEGIRFGPVPSFIGTELRKHLDLSKVTFGTMMSDSDKKAEEDRGAKLQRLKELAEGNRDHRLALTCHAEEMKWNRFRGGWTSWPSGLLDWAFEVTSNYGQSIARPFWWLLVTWMTFGVSYRTCIESADHPWLFSFSWLLPFLPASNILREREFESIFVDAGPSLYFLAGAQGAISFIMLFLIGLGFRNRFRI